MHETKENLEISIKETDSQVNEYSTILTLDSNGEAIHETDLIQGTLNHFILESDLENELEFSIHPINHPSLLFKANFSRFGIFPWKIPAYNSAGEPIEAPPEWERVILNDRLRINVSRGQPGADVRIVVRYGRN